MTKDGIFSTTRRFESIEQRNQIAVTLLQEQGVAINDHCAVALPVMAKVDQASKTRRKTKK